MGLTLHFPACLGIRNKTQPTMPQPSSQNPLLSVGLCPSTCQLSRRWHCCFKGVASSETKMELRKNR